jgi:hypothetical protein
VQATFMTIRMIGSVADLSCRETANQNCIRGTARQEHQQRCDGKESRRNHCELQNYRRLIVCGHCTAPAVRPMPLAQRMQGGSACEISSQVTAGQQNYLDDQETGILICDYDAGVGLGLYDVDDANSSGPRVIVSPISRGRVICTRPMQAIPSAYAWLAPCAHAMGGMRVPAVGFSAFALAACECAHGRARARNLARC